MLSIDRAKLDHACYQLKIAAFTCEEYDFLCEYYSVISLVAVALKTLEANRYTFGIYLPTLFALKIKLDAMLDANATIYCIPLVNAIKKGLNDRFAALMDPFDTSGRSKPLFIAMISNPEYKLNFMGMKSISSRILIQLKNMLYDAAMEIRNSNSIGIEMHNGSQELDADVHAQGD